MKPFEEIALYALFTYGGVTFMKVPLLPCRVGDAEQANGFFTDRIYKINAIRLQAKDWVSCYVEFKPNTMVVPLN